MERLKRPEGLRSIDPALAMAGHGTVHLDGRAGVDIRNADQSSVRWVSAVSERQTSGATDYSITRVITGWFRFLTFTQYFDLPA